MTRLPRIVHVSADFPDVVDAAKTPVIRTLAELTRDGFDHRVISLNRRSPGAVAFGIDLLRSGARPSPGVEAQPFAWGQALTYTAPARGIYHLTMLRRLGDWLADELAREAPGSPCDLLVGHKLTIEGVVVRRAAERLGLPYALSLQGNTDSRILRARPDAQRAFAEIYHDAQVVMPFAPWAQRAVEERLGRRTGPVELLPCPTDLDRPVPPRTGGNGLITAFHLRHRKLKNLDGLLAAMRRLQGLGRAPALDILGGGTAEELAACRALAKGLPDVRFTGPMGREELRRRMNEATGFVLPSRRESFGLVFVEALFAGLPIAYPAGAAVDGYFDGMPFALRVDARHPAAIAEAMMRLVADEARLKAELADWQGSLHARRFMRTDVANAFARSLRLSLGQAGVARASL